VVRVFGLKNRCYLGVDLGAESGRVMAGLWDGRRIRLEELHRFQNGGVEIGDSLRWDVVRLWSEIQTGLAGAGAKHSKAVRSVGVDTWGVDFVLLSKSDELLGQPHHYRDRRTNGVMQKAFSKVSREKIFAQTGLQFMPFNTLYQLLALQKQSPELLAAADCLLMMPDFFHWCLCGARVAEFTNATTTQFFHPKKRTWSFDLFKKFGLPTKILPRVVGPGTKVGRLRAAISERTGLDRIPVVAPATHDTGSAVAAVPTSQREPGTWAYLSSGTWSLMGIEVREAQLSDKVLRFNLTNEGGVDGTYRLLKNIIGLWLVQQCKRAFEAKGRKVSYERLVDLAKRAKPLRSIIDPDDPRFLNPANMPLAIQGFCRETRQPMPGSEGELVRCALESLALRYAVMLECLEDIGGRSIEVIHIVGGGSRNELLNQFTADACGRAVVAGPVEATVLGNVLMQARAAGEIGSLSELRSVVRESCEVKTFAPQLKEAMGWEEARERFERLAGRQ
jgi:rhamnulokinase